MTGASFSGICEDCWHQIEPWAGPICLHCGLPFASDVSADSEAPLCGPCRLNEYEFDQARCFGLYTGVLRTAILLLKFRRRERLGRRLGALLAQVWDSVEELRDDSKPVVVPVPLHPARQRERGFNQAELLTSGLGRGLKRMAQQPGPEVDASRVRRTRATVPQTGLSLAARRENVRGVFAVTSSERVRDRLVVLVDDVMTTGATLSACARALKRAGAARVVALALARATPQFPDVGTAEAAVPVDELGREWT